MLQILVYQKVQMFLFLTRQVKFKIALAEAVHMMDRFAGIMTLLLIKTETFTPEIFLIITFKNLKKFFNKCASNRFPVTGSR